AEQGNERDAREFLDGTHRIETEPRVAFTGLMEPPSLTRSPLLRAKALPVKPGFLLHGVIALRLQQVDARFGKVVESAGVIEIEMREHDMSHVACTETQPFDLPHRRH